MMTNSTGVDSSSETSAKTHVLVVDDQPAICAAVAEILDMDGYEVFEAHNGLEALEIFSANQEKIGLVLLDNQMPVMGGEETLIRLLAISPNIRVIVSSGFGENVINREAVTWTPGQVSFLPKPYDAGNLLDSVAAAFPRTAE